MGSLPKERESSQLSNQTRETSSGPSGSPTKLIFLYINSEIYLYKSVI